MSKVDRKAAWMRCVNSKCIEQCPEMSGQLDWNTATYLYNENKTVEEAATALVVIWKERQGK